MPGTITRDGLILDMPVLDEATRSRMLDAMITAFLTMHPEQIRDKVKEYQAQAEASA